MSKQTLGEMIRFGIVGGINTMVDMGVFFLVVWMGSPPEIAQVLGYSMGTVNSFLWNKNFTFRDKESLDIGKIVRFLTVNLLSLALSVGALYGLLLVGIALKRAKILVTVLTLLLNFLGYRVWVFSPRKS
ncbi:MAG: GtrA family protein [Brevinematales bacterium]|nr:GtrA family protein [Brevinematales bacterium]